MSQHRWGPRWFVPKQLLPEKYDYYRPISEVDLSVSDEEGDVDDGVGAGDGNDDAVLDIEASGGDGQALLNAKRSERRRRRHVPAEMYVISPL
jgi:hypothetical protein